MSAATTVSIDRLKDLEAAVHDGRCALVDVRERHEYEAGHIPLAINRPLSQLGSWYGEMDRERQIIVYCRTSNRSRRCADILRSRGFTEVYVLEGGYSAWSRSTAGGR
jgi:rhodanese-related sulfurtransferase